MAGVRSKSPGRGAEAVLADLAVAVGARHGVPVGLLDGYLPALLAAARTGRGLSAEEEASCRRLGGEAVPLGVGLPDLVDAYMNASRRLWPQLPGLVGAARGRPVRSGELIGMGEAVWSAADAALSALSTGYVEAQRLAVRREEASRREFVDDLLSGRSAIGPLIERAEPFGLRLAAAHLVAVAETDPPVDAGTGLPGSVEDAARARFPGQGVLVAAKDGRVVGVLACPAAGEGDPRALGQALADLTGTAVSRSVPGVRWRVGVGRSHAGPRGVRRSYREAREALELADRLELDDTVVYATDLLVYRVLVRDQTAMAELVRSVLEPLTAARGGAGPLVDTLDAYFTAGGNAAAAGRRLHLSVRAVTYRLQRIRELTGYAASDPAHHLPLLVAVTGARLLDWPHRPLLLE